MAHSKCTVCIPVWHGPPNDNCQGRFCRGGAWPSRGAEGGELFQVVDRVARGATCDTT